MPETHTRPKSLADDLRRRSDEALADLLRRRPDLISPAPSDMTALTTRATAGPSIARCLDSLDALSLYCLSGAQPDRDSWIARVPVDPGAAGAAIDDLRTLGLVWGDPDALRVVTSVAGMVPEIAPPPSTPPAVGTGAIHALGDEAGVSEILVLIDHMAMLVDEISFNPVPALRSDGISARDLSALADAVGVTPEEASLLVECATAAHLIALDTRAWMATDRFTAWCALTPADQWRQLVDAWVTMPRVGFAPDRRPLDPSTDSALTPAARRMTLALVTDTQVGEQVTAETVIAAASYRFPRRAGAARDAVVRATLAETESLGLTVRGVVTPIGRAWIDHRETGLAAIMPPVIDRVIPQADMTVTCPGPLPMSMRLAIGRFADVESRGHASVFRMSTSSVQRGLRRGLRAEEIQAWLTGHSAIPLPGAMTYLIEDADRAPVNQTPPQILTWDEPQVTVTRRNQERLIAAVVAGLRAGTRTESTDVVVDVEPMSTGAVVTALRNAIEAHAPIRIGYADASGETVMIHMEPIRMGGGTVTAFDFGLEQVRNLTISRIAAVLPA
jgi:hypothetical protein